jgi:hypothetical protein
MLPLLVCALSQPPEPAPSATAVLVADPTPAPPPPGGVFDFVVGLPSQVRYSHPLAPGLRGEVGASVWLILPDVFAGLRLDLPVYNSRRRVVAIRPGVDARLMLVGPWPLMSADVDLVYQRTWAGGTVTDFGLKLGAVATFSGGGSGFLSIPQALPVVGVFFGVRF